MADFILEVGTEELPARFLDAEKRELLENFLKALDEYRLEHGEVLCMATPRRLVLIVKNVSEKQKSAEEIITGPPLAAAYQPDGTPSRALLGFMKGHGLKMENIFSQKTPKGEYVAARKQTGGKDAQDILAEICPSVLAGLHFPKRMRWGDHSLAYARPIRWILALYGQDVVPFTFGPISSDRLTYCHRVHGAGPFAVDSAEEWRNICGVNGHIVPDDQERKEIIISTGNKAAEQIGGKIVWKDSLLDEVSGLVEQPVTILGNFDPSYLEIPEEVLLTSMESHQKSFGLRGENGELLPYFLTVLNLRPDNPDLVKKGWERVLKARLEDARFFWRTDLADNFDNWLTKLENVIYIGPLGSMGEKSRRLEKLCSWLAEDIIPEQKDAAARAGRLAKADLVSGMVGEFDTLQGIMGGIYARHSGEDSNVANAIREQYLPQGPDSPLPQSDPGAILSIADKADALAGCFGLNMIPGGMADPNGLRRAALGIIRVLLDKKWNIRISALFENARKLYGDKNWKLSPEETLTHLLDFIRARLRAHYISRGYDTPIVDAVLANGVENIADSQARLESLASFAASPDFLESVRILKRIENITRNAAADIPGWDENLLVEDAEKALAAKLSEILPTLDNYRQEGKYDQILAELESLKDVVNNFFDKVMVNSEDQNLKRNRIRLLRALVRPFETVADFTLLQV